MTKYYFIFGLIMYVFLFPSSSLASVVINEFVADGNPEWVEFYNASESAEYIKQYSIKDAAGHIKPLANLITSNNTYPYFEMSSYLNNSGNESLYLLNPSGEVIDTYENWKNPGDTVSIGRNPNQTGNFSVLETATKGAPNSAVKTTPAPTVKASATPSSSPNASPSVSPTLKPTPTVKATPKPSKIVSVSPLPTVSTENTTFSSSSPEVLSAKSEKKPSFPLGIVCIVIGIAFSAIAGFVAYKQQKQV